MSRKEKKRYQIISFGESFFGCSESSSEEEETTEFQKEQVDHIISLLTLKTENKIQQVLKWARKHETVKRKEIKIAGGKYNSRQIAALVFLYESIQTKFSSGIGQILYELDTAESNFLPSWFRETFQFQKEDIYEAFKTWMISGSILGCIGYDLNRTYGILHEAASKGDNDLLKWLLSRNVEVDFRDSSRNTALHIAAEEGHKTTVIFLLEHGASKLVLNSELRTPFDLALESGHFDLCDILCPNSIEKMITDTKFLNVVKEGDHRKLQYFLKTSNWNSIWNALLLAVECGYPQTVDMLLHHCPPLNLVPKGYNNKILIIAIEKNDLNIIEKLLAAGFQMGYTLINFAKEKGKDELLNRFHLKSLIDVVD